MTYIVLAAQHGISRQAIEKRGSQENWQLLRQAYRREKSLTENREEEDGLDLDALLKKAIALSFSQLQTAQVRSFEGAAQSLIGLAEIYLKLRPPAPPSIEEWASLALEFGLPADQLFKEVKRQWDSSK